MHQLVGPKSDWPVRDELIRTLYANTEGQKPPLPLPKKVRAPLGLDVGDNIERNMRFRNSVTVSFQSIMFYYLYEPGEEDNPCFCRTGSWCLPYWVRAMTNETIDIWMVGRDPTKTVYKMTGSGCWVSLGKGLEEYSILQLELDVLFVFEVGCFSIRSYVSTVGRLFFVVATTTRA